MNALHRLSSIALVALMASACADQNMTNETSTNDLSTPAPSFLVAGTSVAVDFENPPYSTGTINGQDDWTSLGAAGSGCAVYDHAVATNSYGYSTFGAQSLRISNAVT
ncbi:MAG TPA: hypothetical protein VGR09_00380, partial [Gemmatimonadales bacterium]|nr:hypothetical protein [Gemmatimonadales bacterium]